jgi:hypothetical protein
MNARDSTRVIIPIAVKKQIDRGGINHNTNNKSKKKIIKNATLLSRFFHPVQKAAIMNISDITIRIILKAVEKQTGGGGISFNKGINSQVEVSLACFTASNSRLKVNNRTPFRAISSLSL